MNTTGIILAAGEGKRIGSNGVNKTVLPLHGKPLVQYGVDLLSPLCDQIMIVVGAYADSVRETTVGENIHFVEQAERLGTGHAVRIAVEEIEREAWSVKSVLVGYGDHMMRYTSDDIKAMMETHQETQPALTLVTTTHENPNDLAWGRIVRDSNHQVIDIVEQKDATELQRQITEVNTGFYCIDWQFLRKAIVQLEKSPVTHEYYLTDLIKIAASQGKKVSSHFIPFERVGIGINTRDQLDFMEAST